MRHVLQSLALSAAPLRIQPGADLGPPAGLTNLALGGLQEQGLPPQVGTLRRAQPAHPADGQLLHRGPAQPATWEH